MVDLTNIGTLFAFILVCIGIIDPALPGSGPRAAVPRAVRAGAHSRARGGDVVRGLALYLPPTSWWRFFGWLAVGLVIYFCYGFWRSRLQQSHRTQKVA